MLIPTTISQRTAAVLTLVLADRLGLDDTDRLTSASSHSATGDLWELEYTRTASRP